MKKHDSKKQNNYHFSTAANPSLAAQPLGDKLSFEGVEAFNLLRTNLQFSFADKKKCHVIGVTSSNPAAGKSLISANLALSFAKMKYRVLLIDGDLRLPTIANKMQLQQKPGLSNLLVSNEDPKNVIQRYNNLLDVLTAGEIPPTPSELLGSEQMGDLFKTVSEEYDYIILDLPPVNAVPDALVVSKYIDGIMMVVRENHDEKPLLKEAMRQIEYAKVRFLGFVFNNGERQETRYGKYKKNKNYYGSNKA